MGVSASYRTWIEETLGRVTLVRGRAMEGYWQVPGDVLDDPEALEVWMSEALKVAERAAEKKRAGSARSRR